MSKAHGIGESIERGVLTQIELPAKHVPDAEDHRFDARLDEPVTANDLTLDDDVAVSIYGTIVIPEDTVFEIKTCQEWIDDAGSRAGRRRGRVKIDRDAHVTLVDLDGWYLITVVDGDVVLAAVLIPAADLTERLSSRWTVNGSTERRKSSAQVPWHKIGVPADMIVDDEHGVAA